MRRRLVLAYIGLTWVVADPARFAEPVTTTVTG